MRQGASGGGISIGVAARNSLGGGTRSAQIAPSAPSGAPAAGTPAWYNGLWTSLHLTPTCQASKQDIATFAAARRAAVGRGNFRRNVRGMNTQRGTRTQNAAALSLSLCGSELYDGTVIGISVASSAFAADGAYYGMRDQADNAHRPAVIAAWWPGEAALTRLLKRVGHLAMRDTPDYTVGPDGKVISSTMSHKFGKAMSHGYAAVFGYGANLVVFQGDAVPPSILAMSDEEWQGQAAEFKKDKWRKHYWLRITTSALGDVEQDLFKQYGDAAPPAIVSCELRAKLLRMMKIWVEGNPEMLEGGTPAGRGQGRRPGADAAGSRGSAAASAGLFIEEHSPSEVTYDLLQWVFSVLRDLLLQNREKATASAMATQDLLDQDSGEHKIGALLHKIMGVHKFAAAPGQGASMRGTYVPSPGTEAPLIFEILQSVREFGTEVVPALAAVKAAASGSAVADVHALPLSVQTSELANRKVVELLYSKEAAEEMEKAQQGITLHSLGVAAAKFGQQAAAAAAEAIAAGNAAASAAREATVEAQGAKQEAGRAAAAAAQNAEQGERIERRLINSSANMHSLLQSVPGLSRQIDYVQMQMANTKDAIVSEVRTMLDGYMDDLRKEFGAKPNGEAGPKASGDMSSADGSAAAAAAKPAAPSTSGLPGDPSSTPMAAAASPAVITPALVTPAFNMLGMLGSLPFVGFTPRAGNDAAAGSTPAFARGNLGCEEAVAAVEKEVAAAKEAQEQAADGADMGRKYDSEAMASSLKKCRLEPGSTHNSQHGALLLGGAGAGPQPVAPWPPLSSPPVIKRPQFTSKPAWVRMGEALTRQHFPPPETSPSAKAGAAASGAAPPLFNEATLRALEAMVRAGAEALAAAAAAAPAGAVPDAAATAAAAVWGSMGSAGGGQEEREAMSTGSSFKNALAGQDYLMGSTGTSGVKVVDEEKAHPGLLHALAQEGGAVAAGGPVINIAHVLVRHEDDGDGGAFDGELDVLGAGATGAGTSTMMTAAGQAGPGAAGAGGSSQQPGADGTARAGGIGRHGGRGPAA